MEVRLKLIKQALDDPASGAPYIDAEEVRGTLMLAERRKGGEESPHESTFDLVLIGPEAQVVHVARGVAPETFREMI